MHRLIKSFLLITCVISSACATEKSIYGVHEKIAIVDLGNIVVKAKLDTGAKTTSLGATDIQFFEKNGEDWVRFKPQIKDANLPMVEHPIVRHSNIKRRMDDIFDEEVLYTRRPVIMLQLCMNGKVYPVEVNLTDRSRFNYPLLIGTSALTEFNAIVDPSLKYQSNPDCK